MQPARDLKQTIPRATSVGTAPEIAELSLTALVKASVAIRGKDVLVRPVAGHGEPLTLAALDHQAARLAVFLRSVEPDPGANVLVTTALGDKALITMLACFKAGLTPCFVPVDLDADALAGQLERLEAPIAIGPGEYGELRPLLPLREAAMRSFHLRLAAGFGPSVPDGVADLGLVMGEDTPLPAPFSAAKNSRIRFISPQDRDGAGILLNEPALMAASLEVARELRATPGSRIITTMVGMDLASIASSFGTGLMAELEVTPLGLFSLARLWACLSSSITTHLVVPAVLEEALVQTGVTSHKALASLILVHEAGADDAGRPEAGLHEAGVGAKGSAAANADCMTLDIWRPQPGSITVRRRLASTN